jgi:hypothetical protein
MSIESFNGGLGSGKTFRMTLRLKEEMENGVNIMANYNLHEPFKYEKINPMDLVNGLFDDSLDNTAIGLTEAYTFLDSRFSGSEASRYISYFILQTRKRKIKIFYDAQMIDSVEYRLRGVTNRIYECQKLIKDKTKDKEAIDNIIGFIFHISDDDGDDYYEVMDIEVAKTYFDMNLYDTHDVLLPTYLAPITDIKEILKIYDRSGGNRESFLSIIRTENPYITYDKARAIFSLLGNNKVDEVKKIMRLK